MASQPNFYSNPAFCQQSEFYNVQRAHRALSPARNVRQPPVGAQTPLRILDTSIGPDNLPGQEDDDYEEQEFYEEMLVDDLGTVKEKKILVVAQNHVGQKYIQVPQQDESYAASLQQRHQVNYEVNISEKTSGGKQRYEYIPMQSQDVNKCPTPSKKAYIHEQVPAIESGRLHRYAVIEAKEETDVTTKHGNGSGCGSGSGRYALVPLEELNTIVGQQQNNHRYEYIRESPSKYNENRYEYVSNSPQKQIVENNSVKGRAANPIATQKLHQLLSTPRKGQSRWKATTPQKNQSPHAITRTTATMMMTTTTPPPPPPPPAPAPMTAPLSPIKRDARTLQMLPARSPNSKAQQKLNYTIGTRQVIQDKRHTAIVPPMCSSPIQSVYSETTYSNKSESWMNISSTKGAGHAILTVSALMMFLCGAVTSGLAFYMISIMGRLYFLDFGLIAGFTCLILGLMGFRSRNVYWLPNRNYITGYIVLSFFSLLTCAGLLVLLFMRPRPGTPLADMTSGAVCGISGFSLFIAVIGVFSSYCCTYPPPDNRVQHCVQGFTL